MAATSAAAWNSSSSARFLSLLAKMRNLKLVGAEEEHVDVAAAPSPAHTLPGPKKFKIVISHRTGIWSDGCFLSYADNNATTASGDALRPRAISGADPLGASASYSELQRLASVSQLLALRAAVNDNMLATVNATAVSWDYAARSTARVLAQCARDRTAAECDRCLEYSALVAASCCW
ncbi:hypothetical protein ACQ4PT_044071 [Festuca glaucescens]